MPSTAPDVVFIKQVFHSEKVSWVVWYELSYVYSLVHRWTQDLAEHYVVIALRQTRSETNLKIY